MAYENCCAKSHNNPSQGVLHPDGLPCIEDWLMTAASVYGSGYEKRDNMEVLCKDDLGDSPLGFQSLRLGF